MAANQKSAGSSPVGVTTMDLLDLINKMKECQHADGISIYEHGIQVFEKYLDLFLCADQESWRLPEWYNNALLWDNLVDGRTMFYYMVFHDCGKPFCKSVDSDGNIHYPDHAYVSSAIWSSFQNCLTESDLIELDMWAHNCHEPDLFVQHHLAPTLLIAALCEIHANAPLFGGIESESFKIKWSRIDRLGKKLIKYLKQVDENRG